MNKNWSYFANAKNKMKGKANRYLNLAR